MSSLRTIDLSAVDDLVDFVRGRGYVLGFSDREFSQFFAAELGIDIDDAVYSEYGGSKGKRLRCFLQKADDPTALKALRALWEIRVDLLLRTGQKDPVANAEARFLKVISQLGPASGLVEPQHPSAVSPDQKRLKLLQDELMALGDIAPQPRGYAFERLLKSMFDVYGLAPREAFRNRGEQIDGSFVLGNETYLLEAKWQSPAIGAADLHAFHGKLESKAGWARGLFISHSGFTEDGLAAFGRGKRVVCMDGLDLYEMFQRALHFNHVLDGKVRRAAETGLPFVRVRDLFPA